MKELREVENFDVTSDAFKSGDLKMVKVKRGKRGGRQSRSLVFRISRTAKPDEETSTPLRELKNKEHQVFEEDPSGSRMDASRSNPNEADCRSNRIILGPNSRVLNDGSKETVTRIAEAKSNQPRRSSRRVVLRVQKERQPNYPVKEPPKGPPTFAFGPSRRNEPQVCLGEKKKRGRKPAVRGTECTQKRKYGRRGRPPKSPPKFPKQLSLVKPGGGPSEKVVIMAPPQNSVWTLVPKELLESEFFEGQLLRARRPTPVPTEKEKDPKRPTVIYFKKKDPPNRVSKTENDMLYLFNKYRMFQDIVLKNYYELAGGNLNETENMLSNFLANRSERARKAANSGERQQVNSPHYSVFDPNSAGSASGPVIRGSEPPPSSGDPCSSPEVRDTLSRRIIVQSLQILYSEEAVL